MLVQVWGEISRDGDLAAVAEGNLAHLRTLLIGGLRPWAEQRDGPELGLTTATQTADLVIAVSFGYATLLALRPSADSDELRGHLLAALRLTSDHPADRTATHAS
ncbi:hypothetical protein HQQ80_18945 [Microbacteriaceae bacterium VKM Ac-2855]|nr:hypothetical protein [Microbacteriaceae bacterium VKM Ac-2855]